MKEAKRIPVQNNQLGPELSREVLIQADENLAHVLVCLSSLPLPLPTPCIVSALQIFSLIGLHPLLGRLPDGFVSAPFNITRLVRSPNKDLLLILSRVFLCGRAELPRKQSQSIHGHPINASELVHKDPSP